MSQASASAVPAVPAVPAAPAAPPRRALGDIALVPAVDQNNNVQPVRRSLGDIGFQARPVQGPAPRPAPTQN